MKDISSVAYDPNRTASARLLLLKFLHINVLSHFDFIHRLKNNLIIVFHLQVNQTLNKNSASKTRVEEKKIPM